jgi:hypothetical protein
LEKAEVDPELQFFAAIEAGDFPDLIAPDSCGQSFNKLFKSRLIAGNNPVRVCFVNACRRERELPACAEEGEAGSLRDMENEIEAFIRFLAVERGLSENYQLSTQRSLGEFAAWCLQRKQIIARGTSDYP